MQDEVIATQTPQRVAWNKGKLTGAKPPLRPKHAWSIRTKLQIEGRVRDLAMFNLAIDSKLRGCDVVAIRVEDVAALWQSPRCVSDDGSTVSITDVPQQKSSWRFRSRGGKFIADHKKSLNLPDRSGRNST